MAEAAPDGSPVELYASMSDDHDSAGLVHRAIPAGASVLELGAGTGRVTRPLTALGHRVTAVDESAGMLAHIDTETVLSRIEDLDLGRRFDAVLLMSYLVSYDDRRALLDAGRRHVAPEGCVIIQRESPAWFDTVAPSTWVRDGMHFRLYDVQRPEPDVASATIEYRRDGRVWTHSFRSRRLNPRFLCSAGVSKYRGRIENRIRHRNSPRSSVGA